MRTRALWWLGAIAAAQMVVYAVVVGGLAAPMAALLQLSGTIAAGGTQAVTGAPAAAQQLLISAGLWLGAHLGAVVAVTAAVFSAWLALGVLDVAAQIGIVTQVDESARWRPASVRVGMRDGFRHWWRAIALFALAALPSLTYLLVMAVVVLVTVSIPLYMGELPKPGAAFVANMVLSPLSALVSLSAVPLGVLVQLALRFAVLENLAWRASVRSAWRLSKANLAEVAIAFLVVALVSSLATLAFVVAAAAAAAIASVLVLGAALLATSGDTASAGRIAGFGAAGFAGLLFLAFQAVMFVWQSAMWTLVWRDRTAAVVDSSVAERGSTIQRSVTAPTTEGSV